MNEQTTTDTCIYDGAQLTYDMHDEDIYECPRCGWTNDPKACPECEGRGKYGDGSTCDRCHGNG